MSPTSMSVTSPRPPVRFMTVAMLLAAALSAATLAAPAHAQSTPKQWNCIGNASVAWDLQIEGCTRAIKSGQYKGKDLSWAYFNRGNVHAHNGRFDRAIADYTQAIKLDPDDADGYNNRGNAYRRAGQLDRAIADFNLAIKLAPTDPDPVNGRGDAYLGKNQPDRALEDFNRAIKLDPDKPQAYFNRGMVLERKGELQEALSDFERFAQLDPADPDGHEASQRVREAIRKKADEKWN